MDSESGGQQFLSYLKQLPVEHLQKLYESSATCVAILRYLAPTDQMFIMKLVLIDQPVPLVIIESWLPDKNNKLLESSLENLRTLHLIQDDNKRTKCLLLSQTFRTGLRRAILTCKVTGLDECSVEEKYKKSIMDLDRYGNERWECILKYLALPSADTEKAVSLENRQVLQFAGFVRSSNIDNTEITSAGFKFLLTDRTSQLWIYLLNYLKYLQAKSIDIVEPLTLLFHLSFCTLGKAYSSKNLSDFMEDFLQQLREAGIVHQRKRKSGWFYPTSLALSLASGVNSAELPQNFTTGSGNNKIIDKRRSGFIVVETNYRIYAYTDSVLQLAIVSTFSDMTYRFGNLSVGAITRESVRRALQVGITSKQIVEYLKCNAHDVVMNNENIVPPVICDQLRLWELERDRFQFDESALFSNFMSDDEYQTFRLHVKHSNGLLWENPQNRSIVVASHAVESAKNFWKQHQK